MKTATEYREELHALVDTMDDETFELWFGCFNYESMGDLPAVYLDKYRVIKARHIIEMSKNLHRP